MLKIDYLSKLVSFVSNFILFILFPFGLNCLEASYFTVISSDIGTLVHRIEKCSTFLRVVVKWPGN